MAQWQQELDYLKEQVSELCCPVVNCAFHNANFGKNQSKRTLSEITDELENSKTQAKTPKNQNEKPFIFPSKKHTAKANIQSNFLKGPSTIINDNNIYKNLETDNDDVGASPQIPNPPPSPVMLRKSDNFAQDLKIINDEFGEVEAKSGGLFIKLFTNTPEQHMKLTKFLTTKNLEYFVFTPKWQRLIKIVIKNLPWESKPNEIKALLEEIHNFEVEKVVQLTSLRTKRPLRLFQVTLPNTENNKRIWEVSQILYMKVEIEKYKRTGTLMSFNCNLYHHSAATCSMKARCLKCGEEHAHQSCNKVFELNEQGKIANPKCINCNKEGHLASWRGCEKFKNIVKTNPKPNAYQKYRQVNPMISFADMVGENHSIPDSVQDLNELKDKPTTINLHREKIESLSDILFILNKKIFGNTNIKNLALMLRQTDNDIDRAQLLITNLNFSE
ncbi:hypothetical protein AVEN_138972-1 [Araneus ventricosus]|uniref:Pre-C2HC domain-containing protein n=1 Tax=Araneus ventricosus TaxID=182803 RepID=A0A4Y2N5H5_ARAVE|nr:hypothetical protein AVEN_138972-1 [Araneus ventricosus]